MGKRSTVLGQIGEQLTRYALQQMGFEQVRRIHTGWRVLRFLKPGIAQVVPGERVDGDFTAIDPRTGKAVLVECKKRDGKLLYSDLAAHQVEALDAYTNNKALAYIGWLGADYLYIMRWPCLEPRQSLTEQQAKGVAEWTTPIS